MALLLAILGTVALYTLVLLAPFIMAAMGRERVIEPEPCSDYDGDR